MEYSMPRVRLSPAVSVISTDSGVVLRSDLGTYQLDGPDVAVFMRALLPLLNGLYEPDAIADAVEQYSRGSILTFLDALEHQGLLEQVSTGALEPETTQTMSRFFR